MLPVITEISLVFWCLTLSACLSANPLPLTGAEGAISTTPATVTNAQSSASGTNVSAFPGFPRSPKDGLETQIALARSGFSSGSIDGVMGPQTRSALRAFQGSRHLPVTGEIDAATRQALQLESPPLTNYVITSNELARLQPLSATWMGKSLQTALEFESPLELAAENCCASPKLMLRLNPSLDWTNISAGTIYTGPDATNRCTAAKASLLVIALTNRTLTVFDAQTNMLAHFPCSIAQRVEKRPAGELHVVAIAPNPNYTFDPKVFPESVEAQQIKSKLILPPGPNNPVGAAWISLDLEGYGIHGTPLPEQVGRTESHGCFRLANWNAAWLVNAVSIGTPVIVEP